MAVACTLIAIAPARGTAGTASVPSIVDSMAAVVRVLLEGLFIVSVARAAAVALGLPCFRKRV